MSALLQDQAFVHLSAPAGAEPWLVADVGGTNARLGWVAGPGAPVSQVQVYRVADHASLADVVERYLAELPAGGMARTPTRLAAAVATALDGDCVELTNGAWRFSRAETQRRLGLRSFQVLNDFEALALSLPRLTAAQLRPVGTALPRPAGVLAVVGPGTGLGVAGVVQTAAGWMALPGEGGHATLAAGDDFEAEVLRHARREFAHVSAERLLSGIGLPVLHRAVAATLGQTASVLTPEEIVRRGLSPGEDPVCERTLDQFCAFLGSFAGGVALTLGARGGLFIGGGIVPRLGERFFQSQFRARFEAKGRFQPYLAAIPTALITDTLAALSGAALAIEQQVIAA